MQLSGEQRIDMDGKVNSVLNAVMQKIYMERKPLPDTPRTVVRYEKVQDRVFSEMWFMTPGCSHDKKWRMHHVQLWKRAFC